jgi:uncharacterized protein YegP (UPF0339 family)
MAVGRFETVPRRGKAGGFGWRLVAANGRIIASGEGFTRRADARRAASTVVGVVEEILNYYGEVPIHDREEGSR